jgi:phosphopantetheinyl transferase
MSDAVGPGLPLAAEVMAEVLEAWVLAEAREAGEVAVALGPAEAAILAEMPWPLRRAEWLAGRRVAKALLRAALGLAPDQVEVLPAASGAPRVHVRGRLDGSLTVSVSHTRRWAVAALARGPVGVDACDDADGARLPRIASRVLSFGEAEACGAHTSPGHQAAVWALKEAVLKLSEGGVFDPGARSVRVASLEPARVLRPPARVALLRLPDAAVALARPVGGSI